MKVKLAEALLRRKELQGKVDVLKQIKALEDRLDDIKMGLGILAGDTRGEDGKIVRTMNKVLNDSSGQVIATFSEQTRDTLSMAALLAPIKKKQLKAAANAKKLAEGKPVKPTDIEATVLTKQEEDILAIEWKLGALGAYKTSEPFRVVNY